MTETTSVEEERLAAPGEERNLLSCVFQSVDAWLTISDTISTEHFTHPLTKSLWTVLDAMRNKGIEPDPMSVYEALPSGVKVLADTLGGWGFIEAIGDLPVKPSNVEHYATALQELNVLRRGRAAGQEIAAKAESGLSVHRFLEETEMLVNEIPGNLGDETVLLGSIVDEFVDAKMANPAEIPGLSTGYELLDRELQGLQPGRLYVIGARKKIGKSVFLLNIIKEMAIQQGRPILYISTEQTQSDEVSRMLSMISQVPEHYIGNGTFTQMTDDSVDRVMEAKEKFRTAPIYFAHDPMFTINKLRRTIKKHVVLHGVECVYFDYIKIPIDAMGSRDKWAMVGDLAYGLKAAATEQNIPIMTAVQINRDGAEQFKFTGDVDSDAFANSDMIAQAMSVGMVLRQLNPEEKKEHEFTDENTARILKVTDNRHGASSYKALYKFKANVVTLEERRII